jgi:hypothetical protein
MFTDSQAFRLEKRLSAEGDVPSQTSVESSRPFDAQTHEIIDAIAALVITAQAGLEWLRVQPPDLEEVRQSLSTIATDGKRACELVIRLRSLLNQATKQRMDGSD